VHRRFGESYLPDGCAIFPRKLSFAHERLELAGTLSCPEVARLLYLDDEAVAIDPLDPRTVRPHVTQHVAGDGPYEAHLDDVRATVIGLLETPGYPLSSRLFFVSWFCELTRTAFRRGCGPEGTDALAAAIARVSDPAALARWHQTLTGHDAATPRAGWILISALKERVERDGAPGPFRNLVRGCLETLGAGDAGEGDNLALDPTRLWAAFRDRRGPRDGEAIDRLLGRYAVDYWLKEFYVRAPDLAAHAHPLVLRIALLRFLLFCHPRHDELGPAAALVEVTYTLARAMDHDADLRANLDTLLERLGLTSLAHAVFLMKV
jgi:lysine-N-methylase